MQFNNYETISSQFIPELDGTATVLRHTASGARVLCMQNNDNEKAFSISFKTPPAQSTGVFHINEHSVLCGSRKFAVKEPFVDLLKSSMQTFLNAMTFADKTVYPVASTSETDLLNLMDVYMDAVLHPAFYDNPLIFMQEGWHYELDEEGTPFYNGVVYNEMKGALSDAESKLDSALGGVLFPDTAYGVESGGHPGVIPTLTYESFKDTHSRHYRLSNAYIMLYGNMDFERFLRYLDEEYLTPDAQLRAECAAPNPLEMQAPCVSLGNKIQAAVPADSACAAIGYVVGTAADKAKLLALEVLIDALSDSNYAPLKQALLQAGVSGDVDVQLRDGILQPYVLVKFRNLKAGAGERVVGAVEEAVRGILEQGLSKDLLYATYASLDFYLRENYYGACNCIGVMVQALAGWLYDDECATGYLQFEDDMAQIKAWIEDGTFEELLKEVFLTNNHMASLELVPVENAEQLDATPADEQLAAFTGALDEVAAAHVNETVDALHAFQETPDAPEASAAIPRLTLDEIGALADEAPYHVLEPGAQNPMRCIRHTIDTHGIIYATRYYDASVVPFEDLPYLSVLAELFGNLDTTTHTAIELVTLANSTLGRINFGADLSETIHDPRVCKPVFSVHTSALEAHAADAVNIPLEIMFTSDFSNKEKVRERLNQRLLSMRLALCGTATRLAQRRAVSYYSPAGQVAEATGGISYYRFLRNLLADFDANYDGLVAKLQELIGLLFTDANCTLSFAGSDEALERFVAANSAYGQLSGAAAPKQLVIPEPQRRNEAFITSSDVCYNALAYDTKLLGLERSGAWLPATKAVSLDLLWTEVRVKGGAYGGNCGTPRNGAVLFMSWRDPNVSRTYENYRRSADWLRTTSLSRGDLDGYIISTAGELDRPLKPRAVVQRQCRDYFEEVSPEKRLQTRTEALEASLDAVTSFADVLEQVCAKDCRCTIGNREAIEASTDDFEVIDILNEE